MNSSEDFGLQAGTERKTSVSRRNGSAESNGRMVRCPCCVLRVACCVLSGTFVESFVESLVGSFDWKSTKVGTWCVVRGPKSVVCGAQCNGIRNTQHGASAHGGSLSFMVLN